MGIRIISPVRDFILMDEKLPWTRWNRKPVQAGFLTKGSVTEIWQRNKITDIRNNTQITYNWGSDYIGESHSAGLPGVGFIMNTDSVRIRNISAYAPVPFQEYTISPEHGSLFLLCAYSASLAIALSFRFTDSSNGVAYVHLWDGTSWSMISSHVINYFAYIGGYGENVFKFLDSDTFFWANANPEQNRTRCWKYKISTRTLTQLGGTICNANYMQGIVPLAENRVYLSYDASISYWNGSSWGSPGTIPCSGPYSIAKKDSATLYVAGVTSTGGVVYSVTSPGHVWTKIADIPYEIRNRWGDIDYRHWYYGEHPSGYDVGMAFVGMSADFTSYFIAYDNGSQISNYDKWGR